MVWTCVDPEHKGTGMQSCKNKFVLDKHAKDGECDNTMLINARSDETKRNNQEHRVMGASTHIF